MLIIIFPRRFLAVLLCAVPLLVAGCSMPHLMGMGRYYAITDAASGRVYYTDNVTHEARGAVEFTNPATGARVSLAGGTVREISEADYRAGPPVASDGTQ